MSKTDALQTNIHTEGTKRVGRTSFYDKLTHLDCVVKVDVLNLSRMWVRSRVLESAADTDRRAGRIVPSQGDSAKTRGEKSG